MPRETIPQVVVSILPGALAANHQGKWVATVEYYPGQTVASASAPFLFWSCVKQNKNSAPTTENPNWQLLGSIE
jgi:hypothetical protein